jgi:endonuclease YncB( thermonuclease family)
VHTVGVVWMVPADCSTWPKTLDAGRAQITCGLAWRYKKHAYEHPPEERGQYAFAEADARAKKIGLWTDPDPVPPLEWRHR